MTFSSLYSAVCRGKWFLSFREVDANLLLVERLLLHDASLANGNALSEDTPLPVMLELEGKLMKHGGTFDKNISSIVLDIDSGGGSVDAIAPLLDVIRQAQGKQKAVVAYCDLCASAAYYVACACNEIIAGNQVSAELGSIGVMMSFMDYAKYYENLGIKQHTIYSNLSDYKNLPFEAAKRGDYKAIRDEELDPLARDFQEAVKQGRGARLQLETEGLLRGRMFYAKEAVRVGLADRIGTLEQATARSRELSAQLTIESYIHSKS